MVACMGMDRSKSFIIKGSLVLAAGNLGVRTLGYVYRILMGRLLTPYAYGILNLALPVQFMVMVLASAGIAPSIARFVAQRRATGEELGELLSSSILYYSLTGLLLGAAFLLLSPALGYAVFSEPLAVKPLLIASLAVPLGIAVSAYTGVFQGVKKVEYMSLTLVFQQLLRVLLGAALVLGGYGVIGAIGGSTLGFALALPLSYLLYRRLELPSGAPSLNVYKEVLYFSIPTSLAALSSFIFAYADILLIGYFQTAREVGIYSAASPASRLIFAFTSALYAVLIPSVAEEVAGERRRRVMAHYRTSLIALAVVALPAGILSIAYSEEVMTLLYSEAYAAAAKPFEILVVGAVFLSLFMTSSAVFQGLGKPGTPMRIIVVFAVLDVLLNILLIPGYGIVGAALSTMIASAGAGLCATAVLAKYLNTIE